MNRPCATRVLKHQPRPAVLAGLAAVRSMRQKGAQAPVTRDTP